MQNHSKKNGSPTSSFSFKSNSFSYEKFCTKANQNLEVGYLTRLKNTVPYATRDVLQRGSLYQGSTVQEYKSSQRDNNYHLLLIINY